MFIKSESRSLLKNTFKITYYIIDTICSEYDSNKSTKSTHRKGANLQSFLGTACGTSPWVTAHSQCFGRYP